ncbi:hypothetical protein HYALB_00008181 [Hymenoscyphus albidus]|uniref:Bromo domain-containing protein n=1 Tax=Hymenoscyphus albidus TaxID=595503 RepID=A0A9N9QDI4_9HELO|nr:hypothetical protein HYALB_00008181 [Hymenoscyphus albidus]
MNTTASSILAPPNPNVNQPPVSSPSPSSYTPLEQLLLFQALLEFGTREVDFVRISGLLTNNNLVIGSNTYDAKRLSVEALSHLYVRLLYDEIRREWQEQEVQEDGTQSGSKKRKLPNPSFKDIQQYTEKLPVLVDKLYTRYRDCMIAEIREEERNYARIQREIAEIERGEWDERILRQEREEREIAIRNGIISAAPPQQKSNGTAPILPTAVPAPTTQSQPKPKPLEISRPQVVIRSSPVPVLAPAKASPKISPSPRNEGKPEGLAITDVLNSRPISPVPPPTTHSPDTRVQNGNQVVRPPVENAQRTSNNGQLQYPQQPPTPLQPPPGLQHPGANVWKWEPPFGPNQQQHPQYQSPSPQQQQFQSQPQPQYPPQFHSPSQTHQQLPQYPLQGQPPHFNTPQYQERHRPPPFSAQHGLPSPRPHVPSSPSPLSAQHPHGILLPPPNGMRQSPGSPALPLDALADMAGQQHYRPQSGSPMTPQMQGPPPNYPMQYQQQQRPHPPQNGGPSHVQPFQSPQYQVASTPYPPQFQSPDTRGQYSNPAGFAPPNTGPYNSPYNASQGPKPMAPIVLQNSAPKPRPMLPNTPASQGVRQFKTGSGTKWTPTPTSSTPRPNKIVLPPTVEPLSPVLAPAKPPLVVAPIAKKPPLKKELNKSESLKITKIPKTAAQRKRAGSTASSVVASSQRSPSVATIASRGDDLQHVKEEVATPVGGVGDVDEADESSFTHPQSTPVISQGQIGKRKRDVSNIFESRTPSTPPTHVLWTRGFPKISASALESVSGHRNASTFAAPVKEKDAPGYSSRVLRPQDLKSIRSAINAGHRAATAAAPADMNSSAVNVWLPISEELVPPKGIINNAQLEKELMRMFANAIMYNPDPDAGFGRRLQDKGKPAPAGDVLGYEIDVDGVVKDTRSMFADVEKIISNMRSAERRSEELREASLAATGGAGGNADEDDEEGDGDASSVTGSVAKRRRKG